MIDITDRSVIDDVLANYCWAFDHVDGEGYAGLFTEDGVLNGFGDPIRGKAGLAGMVSGTVAQSGGKWRHHLTSVVTRYLEGKDRIEAKGYQIITNWKDVPPALQMMVEATWVLVRVGDGWKIESVDLSFVGPDA